MFTFNIAAVVNVEIRDIEMPKINMFSVSSVGRYLSRVLTCVVHECERDMASMSNFIQWSCRLTVDTSKWLHKLTATIDREQAIEAREAIKCVEVCFYAYQFHYGCHAAWILLISSANKCLSWTSTMPFSIERCSALTCLHLIPSFFKDKIKLEIRVKLDFQ